MPSDTDIALEIGHEWTPPQVPSVEWLSRLNGRLTLRQMHASCKMHYCLHRKLKAHDIFNQWFEICSTSSGKLLRGVCSLYFVLHRQAHASKQASQSLAAAAAIGLTFNSTFAARTSYRLQYLCERPIPGPDPSPLDCDKAV